MLIPIIVKIIETEKTMIAFSKGNFGTFGKSLKVLIDDAKSNPVNHPIIIPTVPALIMIIKDSTVNNLTISLPFKPKVRMIPISFFLSIYVEYEEESNPNKQITIVEAKVTVKKISIIEK